MTSAPDVPLGGRCDPRFGALREAFRDNFVSHEEIGAAVAVSIDGALVVDLHGGYADPEHTAPWRPDTLVNVYSLGKGIVSMLVLALVERGVLDLDMPVASIWPEFAAGGKEVITIRTILAHRAGLPAVRRPLPEGMRQASAVVCDALAAEVPFWEPGTCHGYHPITFGFLVAEIVRRVTGLGVGAALREYITGPLGADFFFGVPESEHYRIASLPDVSPAEVTTTQWAHAFPTTGDPERDELIRLAYFNPISLNGTGIVNTAPWRLAEIPSSNGHATARAVASLYDAFLAGGPDRGSGSVRWAGAALRAEATSIHSDGEDYVLVRPSRFGVGFQLTQPTRPFGPNAGAFGHFGHGGSLGFADPAVGLGFGYVMNRPGERWQTARMQHLLDALYACL
jgi:CubicO group peptidase (beta-lactamase class C family)